MIAANNTGNQERENTEPGIKDPCLLFQMIQIDYHNPRWNVFVFVKASCVQALDTQIRLRVSLSIKRVNRRGRNHPLSR